MVSMEQKTIDSIFNEMKKAFTLVELLTVLAIIVLLLGMVMPASLMVHGYAKETKQKVQIMTISSGLMAFRNDFGDYPPSNYDVPFDYCGAQKLSEALLGWDLLGFHPQSNWDAVGSAYIDPNLYVRKGCYLKLTTANAFRLGNLFADTSFSGNELNPNTFVICDVFSVKRVKAGTPILYYRANTACKNIDNSFWDKRIYNAYDNLHLLGLNKLADEKPHRLADSKYFYDEYIVDFKVTAIKWPHRSDSYILISAGKDGEYGTEDDIANF